MGWAYRAKQAEDLFGAFVDWDEEYFICPECGEPIYADDWEPSEFENWICPICVFE